MRTHPGAAILGSSLGGGDPSSTRPSLLENTWLEGASAYGGQENLDISELEGAETLAGAEILGIGEVVVGISAMYNPPPPPKPKGGTPGDISPPSPTTHIKNQGGVTQDFG